MATQFEQYVVMRKNVIEGGKGSVEDTAEEFRVVAGTHRIRVPKHTYVSKSTLIDRLRAALGAANTETAALLGEYVGSRELRPQLEERLLGATERAREARARLAEVVPMEGPFLIERKGAIAQQEQERTQAIGTRETDLKSQLRDAVRSGEGRKFLFSTYEQCVALRKPTSMTRPELLAAIREHHPDLLQKAPKPVSKMTKADLCLLVCGGKSK